MSDIPTDAHERDPRKFPFGYFAAEDQGGSTIGMFCWYASAADAVRGYYDRDICQLYASDEPDEVGVRQRILTVVDRAVAAGESLAEAADELNLITGDDSFVVWSGTFEQLCSGDTEFAKDVREQFHDDVAPIEPRERDEFVEFIADFGY